MNSPPRLRWILPSPCLWIGYLTLLVSVAIGCNGSTPSTSDEAEARTKVHEQDPPPKTADELLRRMVDAYHRAKCYEDRGRLRVRFERGQEHVDETLDFSVALVRPNKLRMHIYQAVIVCDGKDFHAALNELPDQVLRMPAPEGLTLAAIHADPVLGAALAQ
ncbi:MAG TPA: hypothetical protein VGX76_20155, partial [Pirellulales bacterium]|nr:hypothetical protein [Pirellulales bacterium]